MTIVGFAILAWLVYAFFSILVVVPIEERMEEKAIERSTEIDIYLEKLEKVCDAYACEINSLKEESDNFRKNHKDVFFK